MFRVQLTPTICLCSGDECKTLESIGAYNNPVFSSIVVVLPELLSNGNSGRMSETGGEVKR